MTARHFDRKPAARRLKAALPALGLLLAAAALPARAADFSFVVDGGGFHGGGIFSVEPNVAPPDPDPSCGMLGHNPCRTDPAGAYRITGVTGSFSDPANGIVDAAITGLAPINPAPERDPVFDPLVPSSLSFIDYSPTGSLTYNNLFFPDGSPIDCDFPFAGTFVDVFGAAFTLAGGYTVDLWGDGDMFGPGTKTYGVGLTDGTQLLAYQFAGVNAIATPAPEPAAWLLMILGFGAIGGALRRRQAGAAPLAQPAG